MFGRGNIGFLYTLTFQVHHVHVVSAATVRAYFAHMIRPDLKGPTHTRVMCTPPPPSPVDFRAEDMTNGVLAQYRLRMGHRYRLWQVHHGRLANVIASRMLLSGTASVY